MDKKYFRNLLGDNPSPTLVELGAADGIDTLEFVREFDDLDFRLFCVEPDPRNIEVFERTVKDPRVSLFRGVAGNVNSVVDFYQSTHNSITGQEFIYSSSMLKPAPKLFETWPVFESEKNFVNIGAFSTTLENFFRLNRISFCDLIYMDVQGAECLVFEGAKKVLNKIKYIFTECNNDEYYLGAPSLVKMMYSLPNFYIVERLGADVLLKNKDL